MAASPAHIVVTIDTKEPVELSEFISAFTSLASQYSQYIKETHPIVKDEASVYVREIRAGSIIADLIPFAPILGLDSIIPAMEQINIVVDFVTKYGERIQSYFGRGGGVAAATSTDLNDFLGAVQAIASDRDASAKVEAAVFQDGRNQTRAAFSFNTGQARRAVEAIAEHRVRLEGKGHQTHQRVLMVFTQTNTKAAPLEKRTSERVIIEAVSPKDRPLIYASNLAEQQIKHEIVEADDNVFKKGFVVDVAVEMHGDRIAAYKLINLHQVIDLADD
jgi:hypothetical protein